MPDVAALRVLSAAARRRRRAAYAAARHAIGSPRYTALLLGLMRWFDGSGWRDGEGACKLQQPIGDILPPLLDKLRRRAKRRGKGFAGQSAKERHKLRIALKKLRYTSELLSGLYDTAAVEMFTGGLKRLQDDLGDANDVRVAQDIVAELAHGPDGATIARAGKIVLNWHRRRLVARQPKTKMHLDELLDTEPFWRWRASRGLRSYAALASELSPIIGVAVETSGETSGRFASPEASGLPLCRAPCGSRCGMNRHAVPPIGPPAAGQGRSPHDGG